MERGQYPHAIIEQTKNKMSRRRPPVACGYRKGDFAALRPTNRNARGFAALRQWRRGLGNGARGRISLVCGAVRGNCANYRARPNQSRHAANGAGLVPPCGRAKRSKSRYSTSVEWRGSGGKAVRLTPIVLPQSLRQGGTTPQPSVRKSRDAARCRRGGRADGIPRQICYIAQAFPCLENPRARGAVPETKEPCGRNFCGGHADNPSPLNICRIFWP
jgi:hypothetical protein